jgi:hypothetical protein
MHPVREMPEACAPLDSRGPLNVHEATGSVVPVGTLGAVLDFDDLDFEERPPRTKAAVDVEVLQLGREQRLAMTARRAADLFDHVSMYATAGTAT